MEGWRGKREKRNKIVRERKPKENRERQGRAALGEAAKLQQGQWKGKTRSRKNERMRKKPKKLETQKVAVQGLIKGV